MKLLLVVCLSLCACADKAGDRTSFHLAHQPPTSKDVIDAVMAISQEPLSHATCQGVGTEESDATIGRYLAGFLAELSSQEARNAVTTSVEEGDHEGTPVYLCRLMIRHAEGNDIWSWGVEFAARRSDGVVLPDSIRCLGAG